MKKILLSGMLFLGLGANAQLPNGSIAPNFNLTDINGVTHDLYTYLNAGKTVFIDVSATWCGPCWSYHNTHALENLWIQHGPTGGTNVSASTTNDVIVLFIEGDGTTTNAELNGGPGSQGDWVSGVSYPICNPETAVINPFDIDFGIAYFPTVYKICPNRQIFEVGTANTTTLYNSISSCIAPSGYNNPSLIGYSGETSSCGAIATNVTLQNMGAANLTTATITLKQGTTVLNTVNWTGNLATFEIASIALGNVTPTAPTTYTFEITSTDDIPTDNTINQELTSFTPAATSSIIVEIITDAFGSDNSWELKNSSGTTVASGGPYTDGSAAGEYPQTPVTYVTPIANECYEFLLHDDYGDGMVTDYGTGSYTVKDGLNNILITGGNFTATEVSGKFKSASTGGGTGSGSGIDETEMSQFKVYPNPATDQINLQFEAIHSEYTISIIDISGRTISTNQLTNLSGIQAISIPTLGVASGNYIVKIVTEGLSFNKKISIK